MKSEEVGQEGLLEAALFMAGRTMTVKELHDLTGMDAKRIASVLESLHEKWEELDAALQIVENEEGWTMRVKDRYLPHVHQLSSLTNLTDGEMKTLSVVAYYQPITQADVVKIRGNRAYEQLKRLEGLGLVTSEPSGVTKMIETTSRFQEYFGEVESEDARELLKKGEEPED